MCYHSVMAKVTQYETQDGEVPFETWMNKLGAKAAAKVVSTVARMEAGNFGDNKSVGEGVRERRIDFEKGYRIYFGKDGDELVLLLCGGTKTRQPSDIAKARKYWSDYKRRKKQQKEEQEAKSKQIQRRKGKKGK